MAHRLDQSPQLSFHSPLALNLDDFSSIPLASISQHANISRSSSQRLAPGDTVTPTQAHVTDSDILPFHMLRDPETPRARPSFATPSTTSLDSPNQPLSFVDRTFDMLSKTTRSIDTKIGLWISESRFYGWRMGVLFGCCMSSFVLICNIIMIVIGATSKSGYNTDGISDLIVGDEATISQWNTALHVFINALSTALLAGSNYTMQVLGSPTRQDVDEAHAKKQWLDIGLLSFRNLRAISKNASYNASVFKVVTSNTFDILTIDVESNEYQRIKNLADTKSKINNNYTIMANSIWKDAYNRQYISNLGDLHLAIDRVAFSSSQDLSNVTMSDCLTLHITGNQNAIRTLTRESPEWIRYDTGFLGPNATMNISAHVAHAFSKKGNSPQSRVQISLYFMVVVVGFNLLKLIVMICVLVTDRSAYLVTVGDAAASFLKRTDHTTNGKFVLGREEILISMGYAPSNSVSTSEEDKERFLRVNSTWLPCSRNYFYFVDSKLKVFYTLLVLCVCMPFLLYPLYSDDPEGSGSWEWGSLSDDYLSFVSSRITATATLWNGWLANVPQLLLSFCYLNVNTICTAMAGAAEWNNLASDRKGLRVTQPYGFQRSTYFLQLPYRWSLPLIVFSGTLHWLLSQTFFLVRIDFFDRDSNMIEGQSKSACGFSTLSLFILLIASLALLGVIGVVGLKSTVTRTPVTASCSLAISAACHPPSHEIDPQLAKLQWGVVEQGFVDGFGHCSLSPKPVKKPEVGKRYH